MPLAEDLPELCGEIRADLGFGPPRTLGAPLAHAPTLPLETGVLGAIDGLTPTPTPTPTRARREFTPWMLTACHIRPRSR